MFDFRSFFFAIISLACCATVSAQSRNVKCIYEATHVISDAVRNIEDTHIRDIVIAKFKNDKRTFSLLFYDGKYSFSEKGQSPESGIKSSGLSGNIYIDTSCDSIIAQKSIEEKLFLIKDKYKICEWELTDEKKIINGKECIKATTTSNITVAAWFTTDIPLSIGPLGYSGLPGLIIQLDTPTYSYVLQDISTLEEQPVFEIPTKGKNVTQEEFDRLETEKMKSRGVSSEQVTIIRL